jgi:hypothetical protein
MLEQLPILAALVIGGLITLAGVALGATIAHRVRIGVSPIPRILPHRIKIDGGEENHQPQEDGQPRPRRL